jgi:hypothetical protein
VSALTYDVGHRDGNFFRITKRKGRRADRPEVGWLNTSTAQAGSPVTSLTPAD